MQRASYAKLALRAQKSMNKYTIVAVGIALLISSCEDHRRGMPLLDSIKLTKQQTIFACPSSGYLTGVMLTTLSEGQMDQALEKHLQSSIHITLSDNSVNTEKCSYFIKDFKECNWLKPHAARFIATGFKSKLNKTSRLIVEIKSTVEESTKGNEPMLYFVAFVLDPPNEFVGAHADNLPISGDANR
jgi:hypothetical protein